MKKVKKAALIVVKATCFPQKIQFLWTAFFFFNLFTSRGYIKQTKNASLPVPFLEWEKSIFLIHDASLKEIYYKWFKARRINTTNNSFFCTIQYLSSNEKLKQAIKAGKFWHTCTHKTFKLYSWCSVIRSLLKHPF